LLCAQGSFSGMGRVARQSDTKPGEMAGSNTGGGKTMSRITSSLPSAPGGAQAPPTLPWLQADAAKASSLAASVALRGPASLIKTVAGTSRSTGKVLQGDLMFGRTADGKPVFLLKGTGATYVLRAPDGKPVTNLADAQARALALISGGGASRLRTIEAASAASEVRAPNANANQIAIDLEDPAVNNIGRTGRSGFAFGSGEPGSALTSGGAVQAAKDLGLRVDVSNATPTASARNANMRAVVTFSNDAAGGRQYAGITAHPGGFMVGVPTYRLPQASSTAFKQGYDAAAREIAVAQVNRSVNDVASGLITAPRFGSRAAPVAPAAAPQRGSTAKAGGAPTPGAPGLGASGAASSRAPSSKRPPDSVSLALKMKLFGNTARAVSNPATYNTYLDLIDGKALSTVVRIGNTGVSLSEFTLSDRTASYRNAGIHSLTNERTDYFKVQMSGGSGQRSHEAHTGLGSVSKLGEVHASSGSFSLRDDSWASRGRLPGQGGKALSEFWLPDATKEWAKADLALTKLETANGQTLPSSTFSNSVVEPLRDKGFIPKGSTLATRLERLESQLQQRDTLQRALNTAAPADVPALQKKLKTTLHAVEQGIRGAVTRSTQSREELLLESLGTPKSTYELTVRHAAAARYIASVEGQPNAVFSASAFKRMLAQVKAEAGPEAAASLRWHRALIKTYSADPDFAKAMQQSEPMRTAWTVYKAQFGN
jgi:hypothetical protein